MTFDDLKTWIESGQIDTVLACIVDMQGRVMGKRFHAEAFLEMAHGETHCCNYLLATDLEMVTLAQIQPIPDLIAGADLQNGSVLLCGTLGAQGGVRPAQQYRMALTDPVLDRQISLEYRVQTLPIIA